MRFAILWVIPLLAHADTSVQPKAPKSGNVCIVKAEDGAKYYYSSSTPRFWTPTAVDVARLESKLEPFLKAEHDRARDYGPGPLGGYQRQYVGIVVGGKRLIWVSATSWLVKDPCEPRGIKDGGCGVWRVTFDVKSGELREFGCNGTA